jgi:hypothetical protein
MFLLWLIINLALSQCFKTAIESDPYLLSFVSSLSYCVYDQETKFDSCDVPPSSRWASYPLLWNGNVSYYSEDFNKITRDSYLAGFFDMRHLENRFMGSLWINEESKTLVVSSPGSRSLGDYGIDFWASEASFKDAKVHSGFFYYSCMVYSQTVTTLKSVYGSLEKFKDYEIFFTGHSLGGAMSNILSWMALRGDEFQFPHSNQVKVVSFGAPRAIKRSTIQSHPLNYLNHLRFTNPNDVVQSLPYGWMGYKHHGVRWDIDFDKEMKIGRPWYLTISPVITILKRLKRRIRFEHDANYYVEKGKQELFYKLEPQSTEALGLWLTKDLKQANIKGDVFVNLTFASLKEESGRLWEYDIVESCSSSGDLKIYDTRMHCVDSMVQEATAIFTRTSDYCIPFNYTRPKSDISLASTSSNLMHLRPRLKSEDLKRNVEMWSLYKLSPPCNAFYENRKLYEIKNDVPLEIRKCIASSIPLDCTKERAICPQDCASRFGEKVCSKLSICDEKTFIRVWEQTWWQYLVGKVTGEKLNSKAGYEVFHN